MNVENIVKEYLSQEIENKGMVLDDEELDDLERVDLLRGGIIDSLGVPRLVAFLETRFDVQVPFEDIHAENFSSIDSITRYMQRRRPDFSA